MKKIYIVIPVIILLGAAIALYFVFGSKSNTAEKKQPNLNKNSVSVSNLNGANTNTSTNNNDNTNQVIDSLTNVSDLTVQGRVFLKGYNTPSESYGVLTTEGFEIGLGKYDSMKEQFRAYVNDQVTVTFSKVCKSASGDCCLSLFGYCGTVKTWEPLKK